MDEHRDGGSSANLLKFVQGLKQQVDCEIDELKKQREDVIRAQEFLGRIEALLRRMSMLARTAATSDIETRGHLTVEFSDCKRQIEALADEDVLKGCSLPYESRQQIQAAISLVVELPY